MDVVADARAPKQDRSRATRRRLLRAAVACLAEVGWTGSTVAVVAERAGVSRGAAQHHFPTRDDLFAAVVEHVAEERLAAVQEHARALPPEGTPRTEAAVGMLVALHTGPLFRAALHLWATAGSHGRLRPRIIELEARVGREAHCAAVSLLGADESAEGVREMIRSTLDMARGLGLADVLTDDEDAIRRARVVRRWARLLDTVLPGHAVSARPS